MTAAPTDDVRLASTAGRFGGALHSRSKAPRGLTSATNDDNDDAIDQEETEELENSGDDEDMSDDDMTDENETDELTDENQTSDDETDDDETDDDETDDDETDDDKTDDTATHPATTTRVPFSETTTEQLLFAASESGLSRKTVPVSNAIQVEEVPTAADATRIDLLLAVIENDAREEPVSTEFVGVSDQKDAPTAMDLVFEALGEYAEPPVLPSGL